ncbi:hypothetical protein M569_05916, partial [Genlisea aurea]
MVGVTTWARYLACKFQYSISAFLKGLPDNEVIDIIYRNILQGKLTFLHCNKGEDKAPMTRDLFGTLLVRKLPSPDPSYV